ncbi:structural constituent of cuticle, putative [Ixodes scapularis]|uniref:Structural constituent of cuticle, putative n=1 Tax=Ixodes scapularis TaxID=6945 RepID=B7PWT8_IXOSC|nr:structural constituent of cuticle, putative [Ixodes scapularis]|eukprot:XP_002410255.1 structural constituent of cuticle, putative [Ixodes scapularis]
MKVAILFALAAVASAGHLHAPVVHAAAVLESGHSTQHRTQDLAGNYKFGYKESHTSGGSFRQEAGDAWGNKVGSYGLTDADGRVRVVKYVADGHGFRASVHTNEPGTAASHPAAASFDAPHKVAAVGVAVAAPLPALSLFMVLVVQETSNFDRKGHSHGAGGGASWQKETADSSGNVVGSYGLRNVDGRFRVVNYVAGDAGFRADVLSNEPGLQGPTGGNPYSFSYDGTITGGSFHSETGDASGVKRGSYGLPGRTVNYVADAGGFRATVTSNEAGVDTAQSPADVTVSSGSGAPGPPPGDTPPIYPGRYLSEASDSRGAGGLPVGRGATGHGSQDAWKPYEFAYGESLGPFQRESGDAAGNKKGVYGLKDPDGRFRTVNYVADAGGFRAGVQTNEPGVDDAQSPADVAVNKQSPPAGGVAQYPSSGAVHAGFPGSAAVIVPANPASNFPGGAALVPLGSPQAGFPGGVPLVPSGSPHAGIPGVSSVPWSGAGGAAVPGGPAGTGFGTQDVSGG